MRNLVLIDLSNLYYCCQTRFKRLVDYRKLIEFINQKYEGFDRAIAYGSQMTDEAEGFISFLRHRGIQPKYKTPQVYKTADGKTRRKADWDIGIAMDAVRMLDTYDRLILVTADGDMTELVKWVQERGRGVIVIGAGISQALKQVANHWVEIGPNFLEPSQGRSLEDQEPNHESLDQQRKQENLDVLELDERNDLSESDSSIVTTRSQ